MDVTGIGFIEQGSKESPTVKNIVCDLMGRRVDCIQQSGIYITDDRKKIGVSRK